MFWDKWIPTKYFAKSEICAVEICFDETEVTYYYTLLKTKNNKLDISACGTCSNELQLPESILKNKIPLLLILNGKGIILKKTTLDETADQHPDEILRQNFPALNMEGFYAQLYRQENNSVFISLCRRELLDPLVSSLKTKKYDLAAVLIGAPAVIGLQPLWSKFNSVTTSRHLAELTNGTLDLLTAQTETKPGSLKIEDLSIDTSHTLGFAGALSYLMRRQIVENTTPELITLANQHTERNKFRFLLMLVVGIAFFLAALNVFFYTSYFDKNNKLETELSVYQGKYEQINQLLSDYQKNKNLFENAGVLNKNKLSEYADRIGKTLPDEISLSELYFNPKKEEEDSADSLVTFQTKSMVLRGNCSKSFIVNEWINVLKMQKFIKEVSLEKFIYNNEGLLPNFEVRLITE